MGQPPAQGLGAEQLTQPGLLLPMLPPTLPFQRPAHGGRAVHGWVEATFGGKSPCQVCAHSLVALKILELCGYDFQWGTHPKVDINPNVNDVHSCVHNQIDSQWGIIPQL